MYYCLLEQKLLLHTSILLLLRAHGSKAFFSPLLRTACVPRTSVPLSVRVMWSFFAPLLKATGRQAAPRVVMVERWKLDVKSNSGGQQHAR